MPTLKFLDVDGTYKPYLGFTNGSGGSGGPGVNEVAIGSTQPTDGSELWLDTRDGVLHYLKSDGTYPPITGSVDPVDGTITAGNGLTGGGVQSASPVLNVGQGSGITVSADAVAVNKSTLDSWYATAPGQTAVSINDWNQAVLVNTCYVGNSAANAPDTGWYYGYVFSYSASYKHQLLFPFANGRWNSGQMVERECENGVWGDWNRMGQYIHSRDAIDAFQYAQQNGTGNNMGIRRFAWGMYKDKASNNATANDLWRVQCYDTSGAYTWTAISAAQSGAVSFPKGHSLLMSQLAAAEPVRSDDAATVGMVVELVVRLLQRAGVSVNPAEVISLIEEQPE